MKDLVIMKSKQALTTSLKVAETYSKNHADVMRSIRNLTQQNCRVKNMFFESTYINNRGQEQPMYYMNRGGYSLLAMGFTGKKALKFKLQYIDAFDKMEDFIKQQSLPQTPEEKLALTMKVATRLDKRVSKVEKDVDVLKNKAEIDSTQRFKLFQARQSKALKVCGGKKSNYYMSTKARKVFQALGHDFKNAFSIPRYDALTKEDFDDAMKFIKEWYPSYLLKDEIERANAQTELDI